MPTGSRFFDAADPDAPMRIVLERHEIDGEETFQLLHRFGYRDPHHDEPFFVPTDIDTFRSDLTSVPVLFTWLVPRTGNHLPAALLHDGLVYEPGETRTYKGPDIDREEADRIFRDAMGNLGTGRVRRWLIWTAVTVATAFRALRPRWRWIGAVGGSLAAVVALGVLATLDLLDIADVLPWMADRSVGLEVLYGFGLAVLIPSALSVLWGRLWPAGMIATVTLALLLHVTVVIGLLYGFNLFLERLLNRRS